ESAGRANAAKKTTTGGSSLNLAATRALAVKSRRWPEASEDCELIIRRHMATALPVAVAVAVATQSHLLYYDVAGCLLMASRTRDKFCRSAVATSCDSRGALPMPLPQTEMPGRLQAHFADRGIRMTEQRRAILRVMETASKHLDAAQLLRRAQKLDAGVDRSTVYRTLQLLKRHGLIDELDLMHIHGEGHYYERKLNRDHIHMACLRCGKIMEFVSDIFEKLKGQVEKDCRFRIVVSRLEIGGYCATCSK